MISTEHRLIFLHVPKTGGNAVQSLLLPLSDDRLITRGKQDGDDRFGVVGPTTPRKHTTLQEYADRLGPALSTYRVILTLRPPFERMVSLYFSPHRWSGRDPVWERNAFLSLVRKAPTAASFLRIGGRLVRPDFILRFDLLDADVGRMVSQLSLPLAETALPVRNVGLAPPELVQQVLSDQGLRDIVEDVHQDDIALMAWA